MRFEKKDVRLITLKEVETKTGKKMFFAKIADKATFDSAEFVLEKGHEMAGLQEGRDYNISLETDGKYSSVTFTAKA